MFTADGLRPDSPHLVPPRGAAYVFSLSLSASPRAFVPLLPTRWLSFSPSRTVNLSLSLSLSLRLHLSLSYRVVSSACTVLHRCVLLRFTRPLVLSSRSYPHQGCPAASAKAGYSDRGSESELAQGRELTLKGDSDIGKIHEMNGDER